MNENTDVIFDRREREREKIKSNPTNGISKFDGVIFKDRGSKVQYI